MKLKCCFYELNFLKKIIFKILLTYDICLLIQTLDEKRVNQKDSGVESVFIKVLLLVTSPLLCACLLRCERLFYTIIVDYFLITTLFIFTISKIKYCQFFFI